MLDVLRPLHGPSHQASRLHHSLCKLDFLRPFCDMLGILAGEERAKQMGVSEAVLKKEIEAKLAARIPAALSPVAQSLPRLHPSGNPSLDRLLDGGFPLGSLCEVTGPECSGRSAIGLALLASASCEGVCAYIDASDTCSPSSAAAAGVVLTMIKDIVLRIGRFTLRPTSGSRAS